MRSLDQALDHIRWSADGDGFHVGGVAFSPVSVMDLLEQRDAGPALPLAKFVAGDPREDPLLLGTLELLVEHHGGNIVELGMFRGGSLVLAALVTEPRKLVGMDIGDAATDGALLEAVLDELGASDRVRPHWGVDQSDGALLARVVADEFDGPLDLVVDDASHRYAPTRTSFEHLFPCLRPGGSYVIEDWAADGQIFRHVLADPERAERMVDVQFTARAGDPTGWSSMGFVPQLLRMIAASRRSTSPRIVRIGEQLARRLREAGVPAEEIETECALADRPLTRLALELSLLHEARPDVCESLTISRDHIRIRRGPAPLQAPFDIESCDLDPYAVLS